MKTNVTVNNEQKLYVIPCNGGFSCLGFDVLERRFTRLASELLQLGIYSAEMPAPFGTVERYAQYRELIDIAQNHHEKTGWRSQSELTPELIGLEGERVEVTHRFRNDSPVEVARFRVGKSTGFIPCHLMLSNSRSTGGPAVCLGTIVSLRRI